jgi:riboflavin synthase
MFSSKGIFKDQYMFTGIIEEIGTIESTIPSGSGLRLKVHAPKSAAELKVHDSVDINGACHTVVWRDNISFEVESVEETLKKTGIGILKTGDLVNLELPMRLNERLGGHLVLGHVDTTGKVLRIVKREGSWFISITIPAEYRRYVVPVGSIGIDGVSLTVAEILGNDVAVSIIPYTMDNTIFKFYKTGSIVNIEFDIIGKYVEQMTKGSGLNSPQKPFLNEGQLREIGY